MHLRTCSLNIVKGLVGIKGLFDELRKIVLRERERERERESEREERERERERDECKCY